MAIIEKKEIEDLIGWGFYCKHCGIIKEQMRDIREHIRTMHNELVTESRRHKQAQEARQ